MDTNLFIIAQDIMREPLYKGLPEALLKKGLHYGGFTMPLYRKRFAVEVSQSPSIEGALLWRLCEAPLYEGIHEAPLKKGLYYGGFTKPLYRRGFAILRHQYMSPKAFCLGSEMSDNLHSAMFCSFRLLVCTWWMKYLSL